MEADTVLLQAREVAPLRERRPQRQGVGSHMVQEVTLPPTNEKPSGRLPPSAGHRLKSCLQGPFLRSHRSKEDSRPAGPSCETREAAVQNRHLRLDLCHTDTSANKRRRTHKVHELTSLDCPEM